MLRSRVYSSSHTRWLPMKRSRLLSTAIHRHRAENAAVWRLVEAYRRHGHLAADLDPLNPRAASAALPEVLQPQHYGIREEDSTQYRTAGLVYSPKPTLTLSELLAHLRSAYSGPIGSEFDYLPEEEEAEWFAQVLEERLSQATPEAEKLHILKLITESEMFDHFLAKKFPGVKRYGLEGAEAFVPLLDAVYRTASSGGASNVVMTMPHRGRLNVLTGLLKYPLAALFHKIKGNSEFPEGVPASGDVLSHLSTSVDLSYDGRLLHVSLIPNPSHLEAADPVAVGKARAKQRILNDGSRKKVALSCSLSLRLPFDLAQVVSLIVHGDASAAGQGVVSETLLLANLEGYTVGGTIHVVVNNQLGFTATDRQSRSSRYASDFMKTIAAPVLHVNAEVPEAVVAAGRIATEYRQRFGKDVMVDLIGYRRWGHNELDEPAFTQPLMYQNIRSRPSIVRIYRERLMNEGLVAEDQVRTHATQVQNQLEQGLAESRAYTPRQDFLCGSKWSGFRLPDAHIPSPDTGVPRETLLEVGLASVRVDGLAVHPRLEKLHIAVRAQKLQDDEPLDWATAEALAIGSLLLEGYNVRLSGQDVVRGTFSHRHVGLTDQKDERVYFPLNHIRPDQKGRLEAVNSPLSELAVMAFEYGHTLEDPRTLVIWEAQFGDFANGAQITIDQFVVSGEDKWLKQSGLVLSLPHGYDGAGPEHSSCRVERFLQACNDDSLLPRDNHNTNLQVIWPTTPAQYFHALRRQMVRNYRKPLVIVGPKTLLRHPAAVSPLSSMTPGTHFQPVLQDPAAKPDQVTRVLFLSGKLYYELAQHRGAKEYWNTALIRLEELSPFPYPAVREALAAYPNASSFYWCQEEHQNGGAWSYVAPKFAHLLPMSTPLGYIGRGPLASPAVGIQLLHQKEHEKLLHDAFHA